MSKHKCCFDDLGNVTIVTENNLVFTGQIRCDERGGDDIEFIFLELRCVPGLITGQNGNIVAIDPELFDEDDIIRINVEEIVAIGPSNGCLVDEDNGKGKG